jgi:hypothetical protein
MSLVPDFPEKTTCSGRTRGGEASTVAPVEDADTPVVFSASIPNSILLSKLDDPCSVREAMKAPDADGWRDAMRKEMDNLQSHDVYELVPHVPGMRTLCLGWVLHHKFRNSVFDKNKACLVARGNLQHPSIDYGESFSLVMHLESLRTLLALTAICDLDIVQFNITSVYLHVRLKEELYMEQPEGYVAPGKEHWVWRLWKGLYGLVQAGRMWNDELNLHMVSVGLTATSKDPAVYIKGGWNEDAFMAGGFWVDDFIRIGSGKELDVLAKGIDEKYGITGLGEVHWVLGMLLERDREARTISISQEAFIDMILTHFGLANMHPVATPLLNAENPAPAKQEAFQSSISRL